MMKGDVRRLKMTCPHCLKMVDADEDELLGVNSASEKEESTQ